MIITGRVDDPLRRGVLTVVAVDIDFRSEQVLGRAQPDPNQGRYRIEYTAASFARREKHRADLVVRAIDEDRNVLAESNIIYNAPDVVEGLDLVIKARPEPEPPPKLTEYEALLALIEPLTEGVPPAEFSDREREFLAEEGQRRPSAIDTAEKARLRERLRFLSLADRWQGETEIPR